jgi:hypothetical protein
LKFFILGKKKLSKSIKVDQQKAINQENGNPPRTQKMLSVSPGGLQ